MKLDIRLFKEIRKEVKACRKQGVTSNPCRFFGGMYNEQDIDILVDLLQDESTIVDPDEFEPQYVVYPVREDETSRFVSYDDGDVDEVLLERDIEGFHLWIVLTHDEQAVHEALSQTPAEYRYLFKPVVGEDTFKKYEEEYMEEN